MKDINTQQDKKHRDFGKSLKQTVKEGYFWCSVGDRMVGHERTERRDAHMVSNFKFSTTNRMVKYSFRPSDVPVIAEQN